MGKKVIGFSCSFDPNYSGFWNGGSSPDAAKAYGINKCEPMYEDEISGLKREISKLRKELSNFNLGVSKEDAGNE